MAVQILEQYRLGDMTAVYLTDGSRQQVGMTLIPAGLSFPASVSKNMEVDGLIQVKIAGDIYNEAYALGISMRNSETVRNLSYAGQKQEETEDRITVITEMTDHKRLRGTSPAGMVERRALCKDLLQPGKYGGRGVYTGDV